MIVDWMIEKALTRVAVLLFCHSFMEWLFMSAFYDIRFSSIIIVL